MKLTAEQVRERAVDYLYGELDGPELRAFESALAESDALRHEVQMLERTLGLSRRVVREEHAEEPPVRVREAVVHAARASALQRAGAERTASSRPDRRASLWSWLRAPWFFPAVGVAAAISIVVLRERDGERASEEYPVAAAPTTAAEPESASETSGELAEQTQAREGVQPEKAAAAKDEGTAAGGGAPTLRSRSSTRGRAIESSESLARAPAPRRSVPKANPFPGSSLSEQPSADRLADDVEKREEARPEAAQGQAVAAREKKGRAAPSDAVGGLGAVSSSRYATPPSAAAAPSAAPAAPAASAPAAPATGGGSERYAAEAEPAAGAAAKRPAAAGAEDDPASALARRALSHLRALRYREAITAYEELLRRFPDHARARDWREQLARSRAALAAEQRDR